MKRIAQLLVLFFSLSLSSFSFAIERQKQTNWCWAASVQDVMYKAGVYWTQDQIAARLDGWPRDRPANVHELVLLLNSYGFRAWQAGYPGSPVDLYNTLNSGWKLIALARPSGGPVGHFIVLQGIDPFTGGVVVSDPANGMTYQSPIETLYANWHWEDSVVVGTPW